jgi:hypothetical protein
MKRETPGGFLRSGNLLAVLAIALLGVAAGGVSTGARAEPYLAIQEGYKCSRCHVNMTGGGKRTDFANVYVQTRLASTFLDWRRFGAGAGKDEGEDEDNPARTDSQSSFFSGRLNDFIAIGGDFRALVERNKPPGAAETLAFNQRKQNIYLEINLIPERVTFYQTLAEGGDAREIFGLLKGDWRGAPYYFKAGQFFLPFGLRLQDDTAFTRSATGFTYGTTDVGVEFGVEPGPWALHVASSNGTGASIETNRAKRLTASLAYVHKQFRLGGSHTTNKDAQRVQTETTAIHGGVQFGRVGLLAEVGVIDDPVDEQRVAVAEINFLIARGHTLKLTYDYYDPSLAIFENARERVSVVYEPFLNQFTQIRLGVRDNRGIPQNPGQNATLVFGELHLFF